MSDESVPPEFVFRLLILMDGEGNISLRGHVHDLGLAYAAIELAKDALRRHHAPAYESAIKKATLLDMPPNGGIS